MCTYSDPVSRNAYPPAQFHLTPEQVGLVFLCSAVSYMVLSLVAGPLSDKFVSLHVTTERSKPE